jgi:hypothetical protein
MFEFTLNLTYPSKNSYYIPILTGIATILLIIQLIIWLIKELKKGPDDTNASMDNTFQPNVSYPSILATKKK